MAAAKQAVGRRSAAWTAGSRSRARRRYAAEFQVKDVAYGVLVLSTIAKGQVATIDTAAAEKAPGVLAVITHRNAGKCAAGKKCRGRRGPDRRPARSSRSRTTASITTASPSPSSWPTPSSAPRRPPRWSGRPTRGEGRHRLRDAAAETVHAAEPKTDRRKREAAGVPARRPGQGRCASAAVQVEETYSHPRRAPQPDGAARHRRRSGTGRKLTLYDKTQWVENVQRQVVAAFGIADGRRARHLALRRRRVRHRLAGVAARLHRGAGGQARPPPGQAGPDPRPDVHRDRLPAAHRPEGRPGRDRATAS